MENTKQLVLNQEEIYQLEGGFIFTKKNISDGRRWLAAAEDNDGLKVDLSVKKENAKHIFSIYKIDYEETGLEVQKQLCRFFGLSKMKPGRKYAAVVTRDIESFDFDQLDSLMSNTTGYNLYRVVE